MPNFTMAAYNPDLALNPINTSDDSSNNLETNVIPTNEISISDQVSQYDGLVINEIMWMGSTLNTSDEWIELYNGSANPIDITDLELSIQNSSETKIPLTGIIAPNGYLVLSRYSLEESNSILNTFTTVVGSKISLSNTGFTLKIQVKNTSRQL